MRLAIRSALTGDILYERDYAAEVELRVWQLRQHFCQAIGATAYFAWPLFEDHRLLKDHYFVAFFFAPCAVRHLAQSLSSQKH